MTLSIGNPVPDKSGLSAEDLLFIAQNPEKLAEVLNAIKHERGLANATIAKVGIAEDVLRLRDEAKAAHAEANKAWTVAQQAADSAKTQAASMMKAALDKAAQVKDEAETHAASVTAAAEKKTREANDYAVNAGAKIDEAKRRHADLDVREAALSAKESAADEAKKTYDQKLADLKSRLAGV